MAAATRARLKLSRLCALAACSALCIGAAQARGAARTHLAAQPVAIVAAGIGTGPLPHAADVPSRPLQAWPPADDDTLAAVRGGFETGHGLLASFGFERRVYVNGSLVSSTQVNLPDIGRMSSDQAAALAALGTVSVIRNGAGNGFDPSALRQAAAATVIQNSLDNQTLQSLTTINAAVNTLDSFRNRNLQDSLQAGLVGSLGY